MNEWSLRFREGHWKLQDPWRNEVVNEAGGERHNVERARECEYRFTLCTSRHLLWCTGEDPPHPPFTGKTKRQVSRQGFGWGPQGIPLPGNAGGGQEAHVGHMSEVGCLWDLWLGECPNVQKLFAFYSNWKILWACENQGCDLTTPANCTGPEARGKPPWRLNSNQQVHSPTARPACLQMFGAEEHPRITHFHPHTVLCLF